MCLQSNVLSPADEEESDRDTQLRVVPAIERLDCPVHDHLRRAGFVHGMETRRRAIESTVFDSFDRDDRTEVLEMSSEEIDVAATCRLHLGSSHRGDDVIQVWTRNRSPTLFGPDVASITRAAVDERARGNGFVRLILRAAIERAREKGFSRVNVVVKKDLYHMRRLFTGMGFAELPSERLMSHDFSYHDGTREVTQAVPVVALSLALAPGRRRPSITDLHPTERAQRFLN